MIKPIPKFKGYYVSDKGKIYSKHTRGGKRRWIGEKMYERKTFVSNKGYPRVLLIKPNGKHFYSGVHRLILLAFVGKCPKGQQARHLDGNPKNCQLKNLAWGTWHENNVVDKLKHGTMMLGEKHHNHVLTKKQALEIKSLRGKERGKDIAKRLSVKVHCVHDIWRGRTWTWLDKTFKNFNVI